LTGHFSAEQLASYRAGAVSVARAARISGHLSSCPRCAQVDYDLSGVSQLLASVPVPAMPDHLTERLRSRLVAEVARRGVGATSIQVSGAGRMSSDGRVTAGGRAPVRTPGRPELPGRARRRAWRWRMPDLSSPLLVRGLAAVVLLVLLVGGGLLFANAGGGRVPSTAAAKSAGRPAKAGVSSGRASYAPSIQSAAPIRLRYQRNGTFSYANVVTTDANFTRANLAAGVRQKLANSPLVVGISQPTSFGHVPSAGQHVGKFEVGRLESCVSAVAAGRPVMLTVVARYMGVPAAIIVFQPVGGTFDVIVVGQACAASGQDVIARVTVPRG
jgi:hypothetical protein